MEAFEHYLSHAREWGAVSGGAKARPPPPD